MLNWFFLFDLIDTKNLLKKRNSKKRLLQHKDAVQTTNECYCGDGDDDDDDDDDEDSFCGGMTR